MAEAHERWVNEVLASISAEDGEALVGLLDDLTAKTRAGERSR
jgi:hypothetical protein